MHDCLWFQIEEMAMIPAKEAKEMLYSLFDEQLVTIKVRTTLNTGFYLMSAQDEF